MTVHQIEFHEASENELYDTACFYDDPEPDLVDRFLDDLETPRDHILMAHSEKAC